MKCSSRTVLNNYGFSICKYAVIENENELESKGNPNPTHATVYAPALHHIWIDSFFPVWIILQAVVGNWVVVHIIVGVHMKVAHLIVVLFLKLQYTNHQIMCTNPDFSALGPLPFSTLSLVLTLPPPLPFLLLLTSGPHAPFFHLFMFCLKIVFHFYVSILYSLSYQNPKRSRWFLLLIRAFPRKIIL